MTTLVKIAQILADDVDALTFGAPVTHIYNPLRYAWRVHERYLERYGSAPKEIILLGMNPGPFGMAQTGVPFGEVDAVRSWLKLEAQIDAPAHPHPRRPVLGFGCRRREISGQRLWGWARAHTPEEFFARFWVGNYCPLAFMEASGRNRTPDQLPAAEQTALFACCDRALVATIEVLRPQWVIGVGRFATQRAALALTGYNTRIGGVTHPSPANPLANHGWAQIMDNYLIQAGIALPGK